MKKKSYYDIIKDKFINKRTGEPRQVVQCSECKKKSLRLMAVNSSFVSGNGCYYECKCGWSETHIL